MVNGLDVADLVEPSDQTGGRFKWLWWLLNYKLGSQGARVLGESLAKFQHFTVFAFILILVPTILAHKVPESWVSHRTGDWLNASDSLSQDRWNSDYHERLETSYCLVLKFLVCTTDRPMLIWSSNLFICKCLLLMLDVESYRTIVLRSS